MGESINRLFIDSPLPWRYCAEHSYCGNGGRIDAVLDAKDNHVASSYSVSYSLLHVISDIPEMVEAIATLTRERDEARRECEELSEQLQHALLCLDRNCKRCRRLCLDQIHAVTESTNAAN